MCAAASVLSIASVNCSSVMAAGVMAAGCRYLDDDLVPLREQGICGRLTANWGPIDGFRPANTGLEG